MSSSGTNHARLSEEGTQRPSKVAAVANATAVSSAASGAATPSSHVSSQGVDAGQLSSRLMVTKIVGDKLAKAKRFVTTYAKFIGPGFMIAVAYSMLLLRVCRSRKCMLTCRAFSRSG